VTNTVKEGRSKPGSLQSASAQHQLSIDPKRCRRALHGSSVGAPRCRWRQHMVSSAMQGFTRRMATKNDQSKCGTWNSPWSADARGHTIQLSPRISTWPGLATRHLLHPTKPHHTPGNAHRLRRTGAYGAASIGAHPAGTRRALARPKESVGMHSLNCVCCPTNTRTCPSLWQGAHRPDAKKPPQTKSSRSHQRHLWQFFSTALGPHVKHVRYHLRRA
jgi:hypothetical protein